MTSQGFPRAPRASSPDATLFIIATLAGGAIAFIAHGGKTAVRAAVTPSPEPFSNSSRRTILSSVIVVILRFRLCLDNPTLDHCGGH